MTSRVAVIVPARSEQHTVASVVVNTRRALNAAGLDVEAFVIDDQSEDDTAVRGHAVGATVVSTPRSKPGLAEAFRLGVSTGLLAGADFFVTIDADGQYDPLSAPQLVDLCLREADLVVGNRLARRPMGMSRNRFILNRLFSGVVTKGLNLANLDCQSGFRAFSRRVASECVIKSNFTYTQEQIIEACGRGFVIGTRPVVFRPRQYGKSRLVRSTLQYAGRVIPPTIRARAAWM